MLAIIIVLITISIIIKIMAEQKLTERTAISTTTDAALVHVVESGTSYKQTKANFLKEVQADVDAIDIPDNTDYVDLTTAQTVESNKTFNGTTTFNQGASGRIPVYITAISNTGSAYIALAIEAEGNNQGIVLFKSGTEDAFRIKNSGTGKTISCQNELAVETFSLTKTGRINAKDINFSGLPTSASGLVSGDVWSDGGTLKIVS